MMRGLLIVLRFDDCLEVKGECPWCPLEEEVHYHRLDPDTFAVDPDFQAVAP